MQFNYINEWISFLLNVVERPYEELLNGNLFSTLPIRGNGCIKRNFEVCHLELVGRMLCGIAPLIEKNLGQFYFDKHSLYTSMSDICRTESSNTLNFTHGTQPLVDSAFLTLSSFRPRRNRRVLDRREYALDAAKNLVA